MRNTIRNVAIVVPVLMTSCHVSENRNGGQTAVHTMMVASAVANAPVLPVHLVTVSDSDSTLAPSVARCFLLIGPPAAGIIEWSDERRSPARRRFGMPARRARPLRCRPQARPVPDG